MIERIKTKILDLDRFSFLCGDICDFRISNKFDLIIIPREAFQLLVDEKKAEQALRNLRLHLKNYDYNNFLGLIMRSGLRVKETFGDYNFSHYTEKDNRMIFIIEKGE